MRRITTALATMGVAALAVVPAAQAASLHRCSVPHLDYNTNHVRLIEVRDASCRVGDYFGTFSDPAGPTFRYAGQSWKAKGTYVRVTFYGSRGGVVVIGH